MVTFGDCGIDWTHTVKPSIESTFGINLYRWIGTGVALGDLNKDGLLDLVIGGQYGDDRIFLNRGDFQFEDVTPASGISDFPGYTNGIAIEDLDGDGWEDLYFCRSGDGLRAISTQDRVFRNLGDGIHFEEASASLGFTADAHSVSPHFFDADGDGDLDLYVSTRPGDFQRILSNESHLRIQQGRNESDLLFIQEGGKWTEQGAHRGIVDHGYSLSATVSDFDMDGDLDIWVCNDFASPDKLYLNDGAGFFEEDLHSRVQRSSYFSMGSDASDLNSDGYPDFVSADIRMLHHPHVESFRFLDQTKGQHLLEQSGYTPQRNANTLMINLQDGKFSDIAGWADIAGLGWCWSPLIADFNLDNKPDLFMSNGLGRTFEIDTKYLDARLARTARAKDTLQFEKNLALWNNSPLREVNGFFENQGRLNLVNQSEVWAPGEPSSSLASAFGDLDNDGDLDLVVLNTNQESWIYINQAETILPERRSLRVELQGRPENLHGLGAKVVTWRQGNRTSIQECHRNRGYLGSSEPVLTFGSQAIDSLWVFWANGELTRVTLPDSAGIVAVPQSGAAFSWKNQPELLQKVVAKETPRWRKMEAPPFVHAEADFDSFSIEKLLLHELDRMAAPVVAGDVDGDGVTDLVFGGGTGASTTILLHPGGQNLEWQSLEPFTASAAQETHDVCLFDVDGDGDLDLYEVNGGYEWLEGDAHYADHLYLQEGSDWRQADENLPQVPFQSGSCAVPADFDGDGDVDLFIGNRLRPGKFGYSPTSLLLLNDGTGQFTDATGQWLPDEGKLGMVSKAQAADFDGDGRMDLVVAGLWQPLKILMNSGNRKFELAEDEELALHSGLWLDVDVGDWNGDGRADIVAGNWGWADYFEPSHNEPFELHMGDFDGNGKTEALVSRVEAGRKYPIWTRRTLCSDLEDLWEQHASFNEYAALDWDPIFPIPPEFTLSASTFETSLFLGDSAGFKHQSLPAEVQMGPNFVTQFLQSGPGDSSGILFGGNFFEVHGEFLAQTGNLGGLIEGGTSPRVENWMESGIRAEGEIRDAAIVADSAGRLEIWMTRSGDSPLRFGNR